MNPLQSKDVTIEAHCRYTLDSLGSEIKEIDMEVTSIDKKLETSSDDIKTQFNDFIQVILYVV